MVFGVCLLVAIAVGADPVCVVEGTVVDARTGEPIEGAIVSPIVFRPPIASADKDQGVRTGPKGLFTLKGVDPALGISVWHGDYLEFNPDGFEKLVEKTDDNRYKARIQLETGETLVGVVKDASGRELADVDVSDGAGKSVTTGRDGSFILRSPRKWWDGDAYRLSFKKAEYLDSSLVAQSTAPDGFSIVLEARPLLVGNVVDRNRRPVTRFVAFTGAGPEPRSWQCSSKEIDSEDGRFVLHVKTDRDYTKEGKVWVAVKAPGYALWETTVDSWKGMHSITADVVRGVAVYGVINDRGDKTVDALSATLLPQSNQQQPPSGDKSQRQELGRKVTNVGDNGEFHFSHVPPGKYVLAISGPSVSPISSTLTVQDADVNAGDFTLSVRGGVYGATFKPDIIGAFADGEITFHDNSGRTNYDEFVHLRPIRFKTDGMGRFRVDGVPVGVVSIDFPCMMSADVMLGVYSRSARVVEGNATEVRFFDASAEWDVAFRFVIGDGSARQFATGAGIGAERRIENVTTRPPMFRISLMPKGGEPLSFCTADWEELDDEKQIVLHDIHPGDYRFVVSDWLGSRGFEGVICDRAVTVKPRTSLQTVALGAGSITGAVRWSNDYRQIIRVVAMGKRTRTLRQTRCDSRGNFCIRYLPPDAYMLFAHDYDAGWGRLPNSTVNNNVSDVGSHKLVPGGTIAGEIPSRFLSSTEFAVVATDANEISIEDPDILKRPRGSFKISGLWPGEWTIILKNGEDVLGKNAVRIRGTESVSCKFE